MFFDRTPLRRAALDRWVEDMFFVMGELFAIQEGRTNHPLTGKLDLARMGVFGMDLGGAVAAQACLLDPRIKAGINYDGIQWGDVVDVQADQPFMVMYSQNVSGIFDPYYHRAFAETTSITITGSRHFNFSDFTLVSPLFRQMGLLGPIDSGAMTQTLNAYTLAFFNRHLRDKPNPLLEGNHPDQPQALVEVHTRPMPEAPEETVE